MPENMQSTTCKVRKGMLILRECGSAASRQCGSCGVTMCLEHEIGTAEGNFLCPDCAGTRADRGDTTLPKSARRARRRQHYYDSYGYSSPYYYGYGFGFGLGHHHHHDSHFNENDREAFDERQEGAPEGEIMDEGMDEGMNAGMDEGGGDFDDSYDAMES